MARDNDTNDGMYHPDLIDKTLAAGASFDWITPLFSLVGGFRNKVEHFAVPQEWFYFVDGTLRDANIKKHNEMFIGEDYFFDIRKDEADEAAALLGLVRK